MMYIDKIVYWKHETLPKLAWLAEYVEGDRELTVHCGSAVEGTDQFFAEGAWDDEFDRATFDNSLVFTGSGGLLKDGNIIIVTPCNTIEAVYVLRQANQLLISNSIPFLLEYTDKCLDFNYLGYEDDALSISDGLSKYKRQIRLQNNEEINVFYYTNIEISSDLLLSENGKAPAITFRDYQHYHEYLIHKLKKIDANFNSDLRSGTYAPIVFASSGYDSSACAALGRDIGCDEAVVYNSKKRRNDSGKPIVEALGYSKVHEKNENDYLDYNLAHEFLASGELGTSIYFSSAEKCLENKYLLSGVHGDKMWNVNSIPDSDIKRSFYPDVARKEFRLRVGFHFVVVPFMAVQSMSDLVRIGNSDEMAPWRLNNNYDRPIPRRIVESKGVEREAFGFRKSAGTGSSLRFLNLRYLKTVMPTTNFQEFSDFLRKYKHKRTPSFSLLLRSIQYTYYVVRIFLHARNVLTFNGRHELPRHFTCSPWAPSFLFIWATEKIKPNYRFKI